MKILIAALCLLPTLAFAQSATRAVSALDAYAVTVAGTAVNAINNKPTNQCVIQAGAVALVVDPSGATAGVAAATTAINVPPNTTFNCGQLVSAHISVNCLTSVTCSWTGYRE